MPEPLDPAAYRDLVRRALHEDIGPGDVTTEALVAPEARGHGTLMAKSALVLAGLDLARATFAALDPSVICVFARADGDRCRAGDAIGTVDGPARALLTAERTALNFLQYLSGIATLTRAFVDAAGGDLTILDTRKTTPTLRTLAKYAVRCGGGTNHRTGLYDAILIKDNHIRVAGGVAEAVRRARAARPGWPIEVEAQSLAEVDAAVAAGAEVILLDNLDDDRIRIALDQIAGRARVELSGGMTFARVQALARVGAHTVSVGALTHSAPAADISLELQIDVRSAAG